MQRLDLSSTQAHKEESRLKAFLWPDLKTLPGAESAIDAGKVTAFVIAGLTCLFVILRGTPVGLIDAAIIAGLGFGIGRKSRTCAILALAIYLLEQLIAYANQAGSWNIVLVVIICFLFVNAVRGTFAYHSLKRLHTSTDNSMLI